MDWTAPDAEVFRFVTDEIRLVGVLLGRRLYETMLYGQSADQDPSLDEAMLGWAALRKPLPEVVFTTTLPAVQGTARLAAVVWRRRSSGCEPSRGKATSPSAARRSRPRRPRRD